MPNLNSPSRLLLNDFSFMSMRLGSVIMSRIERGLAFPDPFRLTTGISEAEP